MSQQMTPSTIAPVQNAQALMGHETIAQSEIDLGPIESVPLGQGRPYTFAGQTVAVFRQRDGQLFATDNSCPHREGPLSDGILGADTLICPLHMWKFDLKTGKCIGEDAQLRTYPVREVNGRIWISLFS